MFIIEEKYAISPVSKEMSYPPAVIDAVGCAEPKACSGRINFDTEMEHTLSELLELGY
jgi:hypothetical protein